VLVVLVLFLFAQGEYGWGLLAGWVMTFLDTVDGKLARVTVTSTPLGNVFDHGIDLIHPPLWYLAWGAGFAPVVTQVAGLGLPAIYAIIFAGYIGGRLCEGAFQLWVARFSIFTWRPFDSYFRLIVARRNPSMIMLTAGFCAGRPDLGLLAVAAWHAASLAILLVRLLQGAAVRLRGDTARSWLTEIGQTVDESALAVRVFTHAGAIPRQA
jgi:phosphatidylglycerophosphate synthase